MVSINRSSRQFLRVTGGHAGQFIADFLRFGGRRTVFACGLVALGSVLEGFGLVMVIPLLNLVQGEPTGAAARVFDFFHLTSRPGQVGFILGVFSAAMILRTLVMSYREIAIAKLQLDYLNAKQTGLIEALSQAPWSGIMRLQHARITHLLSQDVHRVGEAGGGLLQSAVAVIMLLIQFGLALALNPVLTLAAMAILLVGALFLAPLLRAARDLGQLSTDINLALLNDASQFLGALKLAVSQNLQHAFVDQFSRNLRLLSAEELNYTRRRNRGRLRLTLIAVTVASGTAFVGFGILDVKAASLLALLLVLSRMNAPATQLIHFALETVRSLPAFGKLEALKAELADDEPNSGKMIAFGDISFRQVVFAHADAPAGERAAGLSGLDIDIPAGSFLGVAGPSGAGKTTFADLLVGLYTPQSGAVAVGGQPENLAASSAWRDGLSYVSQDPFLQNTTIRRNLLWGRPDASPEDLEDALRISGGDVVVARMPAGLDTVVGERGSLVSGGERQRLAIARALVRNPRLMILDEATNAIDVAGERELLERLSCLRPALTIVMIAHRLESLRLCDRIVIIENGRVSADGSFNDLKAHLAEPGLRPSHPSIQDPLDLAS